MDDFWEALTEFRQRYVWIFVEEKLEKTKSAIKSRERELNKLIKEEQGNRARLERQLSGETGSRSSLEAEVSLAVHNIARLDKQRGIMQNLSNQLVFVQTEAAIQVIQQTLKDSCAEPTVDTTQHQGSFQTILN